MTKRKVASPVFQGRRRFLMLALISIIGVLMLRAVWLEVFDQSMLQERADQRQTKVVTIPAYRGMIVDRNGELMAVSTPVETLSCNPKLLLDTRTALRDEYDAARRLAETAQGDARLAAEQALANTRFARLEEALHNVEVEMEYAPGQLMQNLEEARSKNFYYLGRQLPPELAKEILSLNIPKVESTAGYRRFYPLAETSGHVLGMTDTDGKGIEGIERVGEAVLAGQDGRMRVVKDGNNRIIEGIESIKDMVPGQSVQLSIDRRIQYTAYKELKNRVVELNAKAGSIIVMDAQSGEILAMASLPSFNPNNRKQLDAQNYRNRSVTDKTEPGSTLKPLTLAAALESRAIDPNVEIDTSPGYLSLGKYTVRDSSNFGPISLATLLAKSSNVGASRVALLMNPRDHWMFLSRVGIGRVPGAGFPNESSGELKNYATWGKVDRASHGYGYGLATSLLQLTHAYSAFANNGQMMPATIYKVDKLPQAQTVMSPSTAQAVLHIMESVVQTDGTGKRAMIDGYRVAGKTGTAYKFINNAYSNTRYMTSFIGIAPASRPRLVVAVQIDEPKKDDSGGRAAAPVFSRVMSEALRLLDIPPDDLPALQQADTKTIKEGKT
ncbi:MAG TPA: penicillin-binding protein 2 [Thiolinea sp.]|nr:penicillin-binding protein 2 [Thiolinea sp.]